MTARAFFLATLILICGPAFAAPTVRAVPAVRPAPKAAPASPMVFYVVKGAPDACGRGCDTWIAAEGLIDAAAAPRFRKFWAKVRDRKLPIYFASPGGNLDQALAMGAMLRERPVVARVARTVVRECGFEAQNSDVCLKLKQSGRELHGDLWTRNAMCNSACPYLILGATTREIAPDALLAVHSPKVVAHFRGGVPTAQMQAEANARGRDAPTACSGNTSSGWARSWDCWFWRAPSNSRTRASSRARRSTASASTGATSWRRRGRSRISAAAWCTRRPFRSLHRTDRSGRRNGGCSASMPSSSNWVCSVGPSPRPCFPWSRCRMARRNRITFVSTRSSLPGFNHWAMRMTRASVQSLSEGSQFDLTETSQGPDGRRLARSAKFSSEGLGGAVNHLLATCPAPRSIAALQAVGSREERSQIIRRRPFIPRARGLHASA